MTRRVVIVGGGTAGWLTAGLLAAQLPRGPEGVSVTLVESPAIASIGVGEGTWPTMRATLRRMGIAEGDFVRHCDAAFKQASRFSGWVDGSEGDVYYHPFTLPHGFETQNPAPYWLADGEAASFSAATGYQEALCVAGLAPKGMATPAYAGFANYGYHLNAGKFAVFLREHCTQKLGVNHISDDVVRVDSREDGDILRLWTRDHGAIDGDLYIDCTGFSALLIGEHYGVPFHCKKDVLFIDTAWATQVDYGRPDAPVATATLSTAQTAGWVWDIGLPSRRGVGHVFASDHIDEQTALHELQAYLRATGSDPDRLAFRKIAIRPGHRDRFWVRNCVAVGLSAGFLEPLEASAIVMIELSAQMIADQFPSRRDAMDTVAARFNATFTYRWERVIDFLKLHYVLSRRDPSDFWRRNRDRATIPDSLQAQLDFWRHQPPSQGDFPQSEEIFSAASYQYILYGMGFRTEPAPWLIDPARAEQARRFRAESADRAERLKDVLPSHRALLDRIRDHGMAEV